MILRSKFIAGFVTLLIFSSKGHAWSDADESSWSSTLDQLELYQQPHARNQAGKRAKPLPSAVPGKGTVAELLAMPAIMADDLLGGLPDRKIVLAKSQDLLPDPSSQIRVESDANQQVAASDIEVRAFPELESSSDISVQAFPDAPENEEDALAIWDEKEDAKIIAEWLSQLQQPELGIPLEKPNDVVVASDLEPVVPANSRPDLVPDEIIRQLESRAEPNTNAGSTCVIEPCLRLVQATDGKNWTVEPKRLQVRLDEQSVHVAIEGDEAPLLFVRDQDLVNWDEGQRRLQLIETGSTELYVVDERKMMIVPVHIAEPKSDRNPVALVSNTQRSLPVPSELVTLKPLSGLGYGPRKQVVRQMASSRTKSNVEVLAFAEDGTPIRANSGRKRASFGLLGIERERKVLRLQLIDERSALSEDILYPVKDARVRVLGTAWTGQSDIRGVVDIPDLPLGSRVLVQVDHPGGQIPLHTYEIYINHDGSAVQQEHLTVMTYRSFFLYSQIFQVAQHAERSSVCLELRSRDGSFGMSGLQVALNGEADGPFYFNRFGPDPRAIETDDSGRFCWFNVEAGLREMSFYNQGEYLSSVAIPLIKGSHLDDVVYMWNGPGLDLRVAAMPTALEQLYSDFDRYMTFHEIDFVDMLTIGDNEVLWSKEPGVLANEPGLTWYRGKAYLLAQAPEFESVLISVKEDALSARGRPMAPMLPRGFAEDLYHELYLAESRLVEAYDPALGSALILFGQSEEDQKDFPTVRIRLINQYGTQAKEGWYFGSGADGLRKAMFFNLQPGIYTVVIESTDGVWLDFDTLAVDYWTTSLVQAGHILGEIF